MAIIGTERKREIGQGTGTGIQLAPHSRSLDTRDPHDVTLFTFKASLGNRSPSAVPALEDGDLERERERDGRIKERGRIGPGSLGRELQGLQNLMPNFFLSIFLFARLNFS